MFPKLIVIIVCVGLTGCMLLVNRQQRIEAAHEMTVIHRRLAEHQETIWKLRAEVARRCSPDQLHRLREELGEDWRPLLNIDDYAAGEAAGAADPPDGDAEWGGRP